MFIIRQLSSFCWSQWMVCVSYLFVCCFLICSQKKRAFTIKHGPKTTCFPARFTSWHLWYSLVCKDCLQTCRTLFNCFESVSVIIKFKQNFFFFSYYFFFPNCPEERNTETYFPMRISFAVLLLKQHFGVNWFDSFTVGCKKTHKMQIRCEFTLDLCLWQFHSWNCIATVISISIPLVFLTKGILPSIPF